MAEDQKEAPPFDPSMKVEAIPAFKPGMAVEAIPAFKPGMTVEAAPPAEPKVDMSKVQYGIDGTMWSVDLSLIHI